MLYERLQSEKSESRFQATILKLKIWRIQLVGKSEKIIKSNLFNNAVIAVIASNSIYLAIDDYYMQNNPNKELQKLRSIIENTFSGLYISEFVIKVCGMGFAWNTKSYLRDNWNILDFLIILQVLITWIFASQISFKLNSLRIIRMLRPLKTLNSVDGLKVLVISILHSLPLLRDTFIILGFFYLLFGLAGLHMFFGKFKNRCVYEYSGSIDPLNDGTEIFCSKDSDCPASYFCGQTLVPNPNLDITSFDDFLTAILTVFQCVTLEGWSDVMKISMKTIHPLAAIFFILLIILGAFFMVNLTLAVITNKVTEAHSMYVEYRRYIKWKKKHMYRTLSFIDAKILDEQEDQEARQECGGLDDEDESPIKQNSQMLDEASSKMMYKKNKIKQLERGFTISRYIMAKWAAKKMIEFLRRRQEERIKSEPQEKLEKKTRRNRRKNSTSSKKIIQVQKRYDVEVNNIEVEAQPEIEESQNESKEISLFMSESYIESSIIDEQKFISDNNGVQINNFNFKKNSQAQNIRILNIEEEKEPHLRKFQTDYFLSLQSLENQEDEKIKDVSGDSHQQKFDSPRGPLQLAPKTQIVEQNDSDLIEDEKSIISPILKKVQKFKVQATKGLEVIEKVKNGYGLRHLMKISGKYYIAPQFQSPYTRAKESFIQKNERDKFLGKNPSKKQTNILNILKIRALLNEQNNRKEQDKNILEKILNKEKQKVIIKSDHEFFCNSTPDVFENRIVEKMKAVGEQEHFQFKIDTECLIKKRKPYQIKVLYEVSKKLIEKFEDLSQQVFSKMMDEDDNLRRKHQDQPYQKTTTSLFKQYNLDFDSIKAFTTRSDIIITSTMKFSMHKKQLQQNFEEYHPFKFQEISIEDLSPYNKKSKNQYKDKTQQQILDDSQIQSRCSFEIDVDEIDYKIQSPLQLENQSKNQKKLSQLQQSTEREGVRGDNYTLINQTKFVNDSILSEFNQPNIKLRKEKQSFNKPDEQNLVGMQKISSLIEINDSTNLFKNQEEIIYQNNESTLLEKKVINSMTIGQQLQFLSGLRVRKSLTDINNTSQKKHPEGILKVGKIYQEDKYEFFSEDQKRTRKSIKKLETLGQKLQQSIVNWNIDVYSIDEKYRKSFFNELNKRINKSKSEPKLDLQDDLKHIQKNIKEFKGNKIWFDQMSIKEFVEDHQTTFLKFLDETVQIKEQKNFYQGEEATDSEAE